MISEYVIRFRGSILSEIRKLFLIRDSKICQRSNQANEYFDEFEVLISRLFISNMNCQIKRSSMVTLPSRIDSKRQAASSCRLAKQISNDGSCSSDSTRRRAKRSSWAERSSWTERSARTETSSGTKTSTNTEEPLCFSNSARVNRIPK